MPVKLLTTQRSVKKERCSWRSLTMTPVFPLRNFYTEQVLIFMIIQLHSHADAKPLKRFGQYKGYATYSAQYIKFGMLQVRENEISLREWSAGGTAQLRTLERTLYDTPRPWGKRIKAKYEKWRQKNSKLAVRKYGFYTNQPRMVLAHCSSNYTIVQTICFQFHQH